MDLHGIGFGYELHMQGPADGFEIYKCKGWVLNSKGFTGWQRNFFWHKVMVLEERISFRKERRGFLCTTTRHGPLLRCDSKNTILLHVEQQNLVLLHYSRPEKQGIY